MEIKVIGEIKSLEKRIEGRIDLITDRKQNEDIKDIKPTAHELLRAENIFSNIPITEEPILSQTSSIGTITMPSSGESVDVVKNK